MAHLQHKPLRFESFEEFLDWDHAQDTKHELVDGVPIAMTGTSEGHNVILMNIAATLFNKLRGGPCRPFASDMAMKTGVRSGRYPDVTVDCGPRNARNRVVPNPVVVFEILSPSTEGEDRTVKLGEYNERRSVAHYVLVEQSAPLVHVYSRGETGEFRLRAQEVQGLDGVVELPAVQVSVSMAEIYEGMEFDPEVLAALPPPTPSPWAD